MSKGIKLSDGKNISGRGRLTLKEVDSIQHYYGLAIRKHLSSVEDMKRAIWANYFHKLNTEDNPQHALCPPGEDSWCGYNRSIVTGEFYIHKHSLPESILLKVKKVFRDLTEKDLLKKCLHGRTQNPNESFNKCIWERIPKTVFVGIETLKFGVMDAVICFNDGYQHEIYFQWIPSHIGLFGNDTADLLAKEGVTENLMSRRTLTFSEIFSKTKSLIQELWKTPPTHPWYNRQAPGGALSIKADRVVQTTISRLASGHIRGLSFNFGQKIYENCTKCNLVQATPDHLLFCAGLEREDIYSSPLLVYDFLRTLGLMDLV
ncbi:uncharacterized protein TNCV_2813471 [Trichonephila clavipes]|nr:uncharacterized protein TNCV_2813471 [Trichonephila clavipes]